MPTGPRPPALEASASPAPAVRVTLGVDTHRDAHVAVALDHLGRRLGARAVPTTPDGYAALVAWAGGLGALERVGIEGANSYGAGLARWLRARGVPVLEVARTPRGGRGTAGGSPTPSTPKPPPGRCSPARPRGCPRPATAGWRCSARCAWPACRR